MKPNRSKRRGKETDGRRGGDRQSARHEQPRSGVIDKAALWRDPPQWAPDELNPPAETRMLMARWEWRVEELGAQLGAFVEAVLAANRTINLTGDRTPDRQWARQIDDALYNAALIEQLAGRPGKKTRILDVGAGGGVPGLIWAMLWPEAHVTLLEAKRKKAIFLEAAVERLGLRNVTLLSDRAEQAAHDPAHREVYDWVSARGLAAMATLAELTVPFAKWGGWVFAIKGDELDEELRAARRALRVVGAPGEPRRLPYTRADGKACHLIAIRKTDKTASPYPRRVGAAEKHPL